MHICIYNVYIKYVYVYKLQMCIHINKFIFISSTYL